MLLCSQFPESIKLVLNAEAKQQRSSSLTIDHTLKKLQKKVSSH